MQTGISAQTTIPTKDGTKSPRRVPHPFPMKAAALISE
jgi:hypothetical protein